MSNTNSPSRRHNTSTGSSNAPSPTAYGAVNNHPSALTLEQQQAIAEMALGSDVVATPGFFAPSPQRDNHNNNEDDDIEVDETDIVNQQQELDVRAKNANRRATATLSASARTNGSQAPSHATASNTGRPRRPSGQGVDVVSREVRSMQQTITELRHQNESLQKQVHQMTAKWDKEKALKGEVEMSLKATEAQVTLLKRELHANQRNASKASGGGVPGAHGVSSDATTELRKARDEIAQLRGKLSQMQNGDSATAELTKQVQALESENKRLEQQRGEFINAIRKQNKLIDVLKRQKLHLEAAKLLQLTEQEFTKTMECHELM